MKLLDKLSNKEKQLGELTRRLRALVQIVDAAATKLRMGRHEDEDEDEVKQAVASLERSRRLFLEIRNGESACRRALEGLRRLVRRQEPETHIE
jgi:hypothetical protein